MHTSNNHVIQPRRVYGWTPGLAGWLAGWLADWELHIRQLHTKNKHLEVKVLVQGWTRAIEVRAALRSIQTAAGVRKQNGHPDGLGHLSFLELHYSLLRQFAPQAKYGSEKIFYHDSAQRSHPIIARFLGSCQARPPKHGLGVRVSQIRFVGDGLELSGSPQLGIL